MNASAIISVIFTIGFWILFLYVVIRARKKRKARQAEAAAQAEISKTFFGRAISSLGRFFSLLFLAVVGMAMIIGTVGLLVSDNKPSETTEKELETKTTETTAEAKTYYVKAGAANIRECPSTSCKVINTLPQNTELTFSGDLFDKYPDWAEVTFPDGKLGYVSKTTLSSGHSSISVAPVKPSPQGSGIFLGEGNFDPLIIGNSYDISFCMPESARSGATCGGLAGDTQTPVGGSPPYSLVKGSGFLPPGMSLELNGLLSGAPTTEGTYNFQICAKDLKMNQGCENYTLVVKKEETTPVPSSPSGPVPITNPPTEQIPTTLTVTSVGCGPKHFWDQEIWPGSFSWVGYYAEGDLSGPVGTLANLASYSEVDCGSWSNLGTGGQCRREAGQPQTTHWSVRNDTFYERSDQSIAPGVWDGNSGELITVERSFSCN